MLNQVNRILFKHNLFRKFVRFTHGEQHLTKIVYPLESRKLLRVAGSEAGVFLQGLITNDMRHFDDGAKSMYAMFLNNKGRVLYDTLIYKCGGEDSFVIECDKNVVTQLHRYLKLFKLKRKVDIADASQEYKLWAVVAPKDSVPESDINPASNINVYRDPRIADLGYRILASSSVKESYYLSKIIGHDAVIKKDEKGYKYLRYTLGVSEGAEDLPPGTCFPLEANCDYLHGVSFHKGCYIGQELTARVHHTGVVRKRMMPLKFNREVKNLATDSVISDSDNPKLTLGKLKGFLNNYGLGLVRIKEAMDAKTLTIGTHAVEVIKPTWWPIEAPKDKTGLNKLE